MRYDSVASTINFSPGSATTSVAPPIPAPMPDTDINTLKLKLTLCTLTSLFRLKFNVMNLEYAKKVSLSIYLYTTVYLCVRIYNGKCEYRLATLTLVVVSGSLTTKLTLFKYMW